jgi:hypothetical protein
MRAVEVAAPTERPQEQRVLVVVVLAQQTAELLD